MSAGIVDSYPVTATHCSKHSFRKQSFGPKSPLKRKDRAPKRQTSVTSLLSGGHLDDWTKSDVRLACYAHIKSLLSRSRNVQRKGFTRTRTTDNHKHHHQHNNVSGESIDQALQAAGVVGTADQGYKHQTIRWPYRPESNLLAHRASVNYKRPRVRCTRSLQVGSLAGIIYKILFRFRQFAKSA